MAVAWPAPCPIAAVMAHGWLGWNGVILRGVGGWSRNNEMNERTAPYNQKTRGGGSFLSASTGIRELVLYMGLKVTVWAQLILTVRLLYTSTLSMSLVQQCTPIQR